MVVVVVCYFVDLWCCKVLWFMFTFLYCYYMMFGCVWFGLGGCLVVFWLWVLLCCCGCLDG